MTLNIQGIRAIYVALGGTGTDIPDTMLIGDALLKVAEKVTTLAAAVAANTLPTVSAPGDVGKVLKVNAEGKWAAGTDEIQA